MREDVLKLLSRVGDVTNAIVLTHNIDFVFLQSVVMRALKRCGQPTVTVFADAQCAADTFAHQAPVLDSLGIRYRVVPVAMQPGFRFHPKAVLLSGPEKATLLVGSGNLTFGGWRENAEAWVRFDTDVDGAGPFAAFRLYLQQILSLVPLRESVQAETDEAFDSSTRVWATDLEEPAGLLGKAGQGENLIDRMFRISDEESAASVTVCSPYFDDEAEALQRLVERVRPARADILVQKGRSGLCRAAASALPAKVQIVPVTFRRKDVDGNERQSFIHAKFYGVEQGEKVTVFVGSANCSRAALTIPGAPGNAELLSIQKLTRAEFQKQYLEELELLEGDPELKEPDAEPDVATSGKEAIRVLAARFEAGGLLVAYSCPAGISITRCLVDDAPTEVELLGNGVAALRIARPPRVVRIEGRLGNETVRSNLIWVDRERELRSTARGRALAEAIRSHVREDQWNLGAWTEILKVFCKHLDYVPSRSSLAGQRPFLTRSRQRAAEYSQADVFSDSYGLPSLRPLSLSISKEGRIRSLRQILLGWFGFAGHEGREEDTKLDAKHIEGDVKPDDEAVDREEALPSRAEAPKASEATDRDRRRAQTFIKRVATAMTRQEFLERRDPELLAADLKVAAILLRMALSEGWIDDSSFFESTQRIWSALFFTSEVEPTAGWIEYRHRSAERPDDFAFRMSSVELSAALTAWAMAVPADARTPEHARFGLACVLSVARLPWLWREDNPNEIAAELTPILAHTANLGSAGEQSWDDIRGRWRKLMRRGRALRQLESALRGRSPAGLRKRISQDEINVGELLWQGAGGFCVATKPCRRAPSERGRLLRLQGESGEARFFADYLIPLRSLLDEAITPLTDAFGEEPRRELAALVDELSVGFAGA